MSAVGRTAKLAVACLALLVAGVAGAAPAGADPAEPTNDTSRVTAIEPATAGIEVDVVGGDSFLRLRAEPGTEVVVLGYEGEPYLRYLPDGSVEENRRSPATVLNRTRYGAGGDLSVTDPTAEPEWARVAGGGTYVWHDHRIHWMSEAEPPSLAGADSGKIQDWSLDVVVDGAPVVVHGELTREPAPSPWPWLGLAVVAGAATFAAGWRWPRRGPAVALAAAGGLAAVTSLLAELDLPAATGRRWSFVAIPALAALCALGAAVAPRSRYALALLAASAVVLPLWIGLRWSALVNAVLPSPSGAGLQRLAIALALGAVLGTAAVPARSVATSARAAAAEGPAGAPAA